MTDQQPFVLDQILDLTKQCVVELVGACEVKRERLAEYVVIRISRLKSASSWSAASIGMR
jgi:hypothetical protein